MKQTMISFFFFVFCFSFAAAEKHLCSVESEVHSGSALGILCDMCVGEEHAGYISAHSAVKLEIVWQPTIPGPAETDFLITFSDTLSQSVSNIFTHGIPYWLTPISDSNFKHACFLFSFE